MTLFEPKTLLPGVPVGVPRALAEAAISATQAGAGPVDGEQAAFGGPANDGHTAFAGPIDEQAIAGAMQTLRRYRAGKAGLERRIVENEEYWNLSAPRAGRRGHRQTALGGPARGARAERL